MNITELETINKNLILFKSIRGSHLFGLNTEKSDIDTFGLFCCPQEWLLGTRLDYKPYISDDKHDNYYDELEKYFIELGKSNPEALCSLYTPNDKIYYKNNCLDPLFKIRDSLLTKECFRSFKGYAKSQIGKAKGLQKAMNIDPDEVKTRKNPLYFSWVPRPDNDGAWSLEKWLRENGLKQEHCGVVRLPNGIEFWTLYYDWFADKDLDFKDYARLRYGLNYNDSNLNDVNWDSIKEELSEGKKTTYIKYRGIIDYNDPDTTQLRSSSISKEDAKHPLISFQYNMNAFSNHCRKYKEYWNWVNTRNPERYKENLGHDYDSKNASHSLRIMTMATEIAEGKGMILDRNITGDRDLLLKVKHHGFEYQEVMDILIGAEQKMTEAFEKSSLPEAPDKRYLENLLIEIRQKFYKKGI